jgi:hypothetical protein
LIHYCQLVTGRYKRNNLRIHQFQPNEIEAYGLVRHYVELVKTKISNEKV